MLFLIRLHYFHLRSTIILCVFIETDDSCKETQLHRSSRSDTSFARETSSTISVRLHGHENTKVPPPSSRSCIASVRQIDTSWIYSGWVARSFHEIARYKPIPIDSLRFVNHSLVLDLTSFSSLQENAAAKFSSNKISGAIVARDVLGGVASP